MIKIVYRDLSPGLHASAQVSGRHTIISLLPGLTLDQRRAALRRIRHSGRMGHGPRVPATGLALALGWDRIKATTRTGAAVVRLHPAGSTLPVVLLSAASVFFVLMATVSIHVLPGPTSSDQSPVIGGVTPGPASSAPQVSQGFAPAITVPGHSTRPGQARDRLAARPPSSGGSGAAGRRPAGHTPGLARFGTAPGQTGSGTVPATSPGPESAAGSGAGVPETRGSGTSGGSGGSGTGGTTTGTGRASGSGGTGTAASGTAGSGSAGSGAGSTGTGTGSGSTGVDRVDRVDRVRRVRHFRLRQHRVARQFGFGEAVHQRPPGLPGLMTGQKALIESPE